MSLLEALYAAGDIRTDCAQDYDDDKAIGQSDLLVSYTSQVPVPDEAGRYVRDALTLGDFWLGLSKSLLFAWSIGFTACFNGLRAHGGAHSVGHHTTRSVVTSIFLIVVIDSVVTTIWTLHNV
jgi:hypothetical protein